MNLDNQKFSEKTLKGFLLKNVNPSPQTATDNTLNKYLRDRVDKFWIDVVIPLRSQGKFDGNKINWYFEIYKEGLEARKVGEHPFMFIEIHKDKVEEIVKFYANKTLEEYLALGTSFLSNSYAIMNSWMRDQMILQRLNHLYSSERPADWILAAELDEKGLMQQQETLPGLSDAIKNIGMLMARRV